MVLMVLILLLADMSAWSIFDTMEDHEADGSDLMTMSM